VPPSFKQKLADLKALGAASDDTAKRGIRKALGEKNAYLVGEAATLAARRTFDDLVPELIAAYDRLFDPTPDDPDLSLDPLASGKRAIASALKELEFREPGPYLRGLDHVQREPVFGGKVDVAADLRCTCAQALVGCFIEPNALLERLVAHLVDPETIVRVETARAVGAVGITAAALLLRLKALCGDAEPEVPGECFRALLATWPGESIPFVAQFMRSGTDAIRLEAASALAECRDPTAFAAVRAAWPDERVSEIRRGIVLATAATPFADAAEFLLSLMLEGPREIAIAALEALAASRFALDARERAHQAVKAAADPAVTRAFDAAFSRVDRGSLRML
jgi:hypothetical protein